jgi:hypothetical protein
MPGIPALDDTELDLYPLDQLRVHTRGHFTKASDRSVRAYVAKPFLDGTRIC